MTPSRWLLGTLVGLCLGALPPSAVASSLDPSFGVGGLYVSRADGDDSNFGGYARLGDGSLALVEERGLAQRLSPSGRRTLQRRLPLSLEPGALLVRSDGMLLGVGGVPGAEPGRSSRFAALAMDKSFQPRGDFGSGGLAAVDVPGGSGFAHAAAERPDRGLVLAGSAIVNDQTVPVLVKLLSTGGVDLTFGDRGVVLDRVPPGYTSAQFDAVAVHPDGGLVATGRATTAESGVVLVSRYSPLGRPEPGFGGGDGTVTAEFRRGQYGSAAGVAVQRIGDGHRIVVSGFSNPGRLGLLGLRADGSLDTGFASAGRTATTIAGHPASGGRLVTLPNGRILVAGSVGSDKPALSLTRFTADGKLDRSFGSLGHACAPTQVTEDGIDGMTVLQQPDGRLLVAGQVAPRVFFTVARFLPRARSPVDCALIPGWTRRTMRVRALFSAPARLRLDVKVKRSCSSSRPATVRLGRVYLRARRAGLRTFTVSRRMGGRTVPMQGCGSITPYVLDRRGRVIERLPPL